MRGILPLNPLEEELYKCGEMPIPTPLAFLFECAKRKRKTHRESVNPCGHAHYRPAARVNSLRYATFKQYASKARLPSVRFHE